MNQTKFLVALFLAGQITIFGLSSHAAQPNSYADGLKADLAGNYEAAIKHYEQSANTGLSDASLALARIYRKLGDDSASMEWYLRAANSGNTFAQYEVGLIYLNGSSMSAPDLREAMKWLAFAATSKHGEASYELFKLNSDVNFLRHAAEQGVPNAMRDLASSYKLGANGLDADLDESERWSKQLAESLEQEGALQ